jgi:hypothetical protein
MKNLKWRVQEVLFFKNRRWTLPKC